MNLPATLIEADALDYNKHCVRFFHTESLRLTGLSWYTTEGSRWFSRRILKQHALSSPSALNGMISDAMAGWHDAHETLSELIKEFLALGQQLPPQLATYNIHALDDRLSKLRGRRKSDNVTRNLANALIIDATCKHFGLRPMRNRESKRPGRRQSAAGILAVALEAELSTEFFIPSARGLERMWETDGPFLLKLAAGLRPQIPFPLPHVVQA